MTSPVVGWTESRWWSFLRSGFRRMFTRYPNKYKAMASSKEGRNRYRCAQCEQLYGRKDVAVDHVIACGALKTTEDIAPFIERMFCAEEGLQVLCKECHHTKTMFERGMTVEDIAVAKFRKQPAKEQKRMLVEDGIEPASNQEKRIEQYRRTI